MSASVMSITASPAAATRRRPVLTGYNKKNTIELVNDAIIFPIADNNALTGDANHGKIAGGGNKDPKDMAQIKKTLQPNLTAYPRRTRTRKLAAPKPEKSQLQTVLSVFTKNFLLLLVMAGLVQVVRKLVINLRSDGSLNLAGFEDMESRIADVELFIKKTTTVLQEQLDTVEKKVDGELSSFRGEIDSRKLGEKSEDVASRLKVLDEKYAFLEKALGRLESKDLLSKDDFVRFYEEFRKSKSGELSHSELSLDEIKELVKQIVGKEIEKHAGDGLGRVDYALGSGGAMVVKHSEPFYGGKGGNWFSSTNRQGVRSEAEKMLKPSFGEPGQCFALKGDGGFVQIKLRTSIIPEAITLEHVAKSVAYDRSSAPKDCRVYGWQLGQGLDTELAVESEKILLTEFTYDLEKSNAQTFNVFDSANSAVIDTIRFDFRSNHGSPSHTCIYRVRVHGHQPNSLSLHH